MFIQAHGLHHGERLRKCSDEARLWWPYLFLAANSYGRMRLSYARFLSDVAVDFDQPPTEEKYWALFKEYRDRHLAFLYQHGDDEIWCQWYCARGSLPKYQRKEDIASPEPPKAEYERWLKSYVKQTKALPPDFSNLPKTSRKNCDDSPHEQSRAALCGVEQRRVEQPQAASKSHQPQSRRRTPEEIDKMGSLLWGASEGSPVSAGPPDKHLAESVLNAIGDLDTAEKWLAEKMAQGKRPKTSYQYWVTLACAEFIDGRRP